MRVNKAVDKYYGSKYNKAKTEECHSFVANTIPNGQSKKSSSNFILNK